MKRFKKIFLTVLCIIFGLFALVFILLNVPAVQSYAKDIVVDELKAKLGTDVGIGQLRFLPVNTLELDSVYLYDQSNEKILVAEKISASIDIFALMQKKIVITSAWLSNFEVHLSKETDSASLNIQYIIEAFKSKDDKPKTQLDIKLSSVHITNGQFYYDVKDKPRKDKVFDANHIHVSDLNAKLALKSLTPDSLNIQVKKVSLKERSGFEISNLTCRLLTQNKKMELKGFRLDMPSSYLELKKCEVDLSQIKDGEKAIDGAIFDCIVSPSYIAPKDISALVPQLQYFKDLLTLQAHIHGNINEIKVPKLTLDLGNKMHLICNAEIRDVRDKERMYIKGNVGNISLSTEGLQGLMNNLSENDKELPKQISNLGTISFGGDIAGYLTKLTAFGTLETDLGIIKTDLLLGFNPTKDVKTHIEGKVYTSDFQLGDLLGNKDFNKVSLDLKVNLQNRADKKMVGSLDGDIHQFDYKNFSYKDISLDAKYDGTKVDGLFNVATAHGSLGVQGMLDMSDKDRPELDVVVRADNIELDDLHIADNMNNSNLSFALKANLKGKNADNTEGTVRIDSLYFVREDKMFHLNKLVASMNGGTDDREIQIASDVLNGKITGAYSLATIANSIQQTLYPYLPALISEPKKKKPDEKDNILAFDFQINNTESLSTIMKLPVTVLNQAKIVGHYNNVQDKFKVEIFTPAIKAAGMNIKSGYILAENPENVINTKIDLSVIGKNNAINNVSIRSTVFDNHVATDISFSNDGKQKAKGVFSISTLFAKEKAIPLQIAVGILPSELLLNNAVWKMDRANINVQGGVIDISDFFVHNDNGNQEVKIKGRYSTNPRDILKLELKNIDLEYIFQTLAIRVLKFGGSATGSVFVSSIEGKPYANTNLEVADFKFHGTELGKLNLFSELDDETNIVALDGKVISKENKITKVDGMLDPIRQRLSIDFIADSLDISFLRAFTESIFDKVSGRGSGNVRLFGNFSDVTVEGKAYVEKGNIGISFLNTDYTFSDSIYLKRDLIYFNNITLQDKFGNKAIGSGKVAHNLFSDVMYHIDVSAQNFMVYNATEKHNPLFYGTVFGTGKASIGGDESVVDIDVSMRTEKNSSVHLDFMDDMVTEYSFITYKDNKKGNDSITYAPTIGNPIKTESGMDINMNFYIDATPDATVNLLMDPVGGDVLRGSGTGAMQFTWSTKTAPRLSGTYSINRGSYNFTFQKLLTRVFTIQDGSTVRFSGDPFEALLDVNAIYRVNASLNDLDRELAKSAGQATVPVNCILNLAGPLRHPEVNLDIAFPTTDPEVERQLKNLINSEDMINRQVTYLLLLSKFYTPDYANTEDRSRTSNFAAVASATLSSQLSKIVNQIDNRWQVGTNIRTSNAEFTSTEVELLLSSKLLNDRLLINGNFGYREDSDMKQEALIGDVDIEYLLNNSGSWRVKAYNHYNEKYYYTGTASQTQGVGLVYKKDFDKVRELFFWNKKAESALDSLPEIILPDSLEKGSSLSPFIKVKE